MPVRPMHCLVIAVLILVAGCRTSPTNESQGIQIGQIPPDMMALDDWPPWVTLTPTSGGYTIVSEYCPGHFTTIQQTGGDPDWESARFALFFAKGLRRSDAECAQLAASEAAIAENQAQAALACREVFIVAEEPDGVVPRTTCPGDDLWEMEKVYRCDDLREPGNAEPTFGCRSVVLEADASYVGSPAGAT